MHVKAPGLKQSCSLYTFVLELPGTFNHHTYFLYTDFEQELRLHGRRKRVRNHGVWPQKYVLSPNR